MFRPSRLLRAPFELMRWSFPVRYSLLAGLLLPALVPIGLWWLHRLLFALFVLNGPWQLLNVTWLSLLYATMVLVTYRVTRLNTAARLVDYKTGEDEPRFVDDTSGWRWRWAWWLAIGLPVPIACGWWTWQDPTPDWSGLVDVVPGDVRVVLRCLAALLGGVLLALLMLMFLTASQQLMLVPEVQSPGLLPFEYQRWAQRLKGWRLPGITRLGTGRAAADSGRVIPGYTRFVAAQAGQSQGRRVLRPGHAQLSLCAVVLLAAYGLSYTLGVWRGWIPDEGSPLSSLFFGILALLVWACLFPGAAFFLDRYRVSPLLVVVVLLSIVYLAARTDHYYLLNPESSAAGEPVVTLRFDDVMADRQYPPARDGRRTMVVVTAAGGGIHAAGWTTRVLTGLHERYGNGFSGSIGLISSVSGGSVGTMYYVINRTDFRSDYQADPDTDLLPPEAARQVREAAQASALQASAWGVAYPDLVRILIPALADPIMDRGVAVEHAWQRRMTTSSQHDYQDARLADLTRQLRFSSMPVVVFNATIVETGQRLLIAPVVGSTGLADAHPLSAAQFLQLYPESNLRLSTAVRLSATFPYVSPICRPYSQHDAAVPGYHVADGGYADNDGITTAVDWTEQLLRRFTDRDDRPFDRVVLIRIQPFPSAEVAQPDERRNWLYALFGPLKAITNVRIASLGERGSLELQLLNEYAKGLARGDAVPIEIVHVPLVFPASAMRRADSMDQGDWIPLSWKLTPSQKRAIEDAWQQLSKSATDDGNPLHALDQFFTPAP